MAHRSPQLSGLLAALRSKRRPQDDRFPGARAAASQCPLRVASPQRAILNDAATEAPAVTEACRRAPAAKRGRFEGAPEVARSPPPPVRDRPTLRGRAATPPPERGACRGILVPVARERAEKLLESARQCDGSSVIPAAKFSPEDHSNAGRPQRHRVPRLQSWRNERIVYDSTFGSVAVVATPAAPATVRKPRAGSEGGSKVVAAPASPATVRKPRAASASGRKASPAPLQPTPPPPAKQAAEGDEELAQAAEEQEAPAAVPRSALRRPRQAAGGQAAAAAPAEGAVRAEVSWTDGRVTSIANMRYVPGLWYDGFVVECDRCERLVEWGAEGSVTGAPGRSRFAQSQVLCNNCQAERMYAEIGAWFVVALAAKAADATGDGVGSGVAEEPIFSIMGSLISLGRGRVRQDMLTALLGPESEDAEVRAAVLTKAQSHVSRFLGGPAPANVDVVDVTATDVATDGNAAATNRRTAEGDYRHASPPSGGAPTSPGGAGSELVLPRVKRRRSEQ